METIVLRTPNAPGVDPACAARCPGSGYVYGMGFTIGGTGPMGYVQVTVGAPWIMVWAGDPYCDYFDASGPGQTMTGCLTGLVKGGDYFYVLTKDPNAVARNIEVSFSGTPFTCPADGGV
jgi:hypothetical protein